MLSLLFKPLQSNKENTGICANSFMQYHTDTQIAIIAQDKRL